MKQGGCEARVMFQSRFEDSSCDDYALFQSSGSFYGGAGIEGCQTENNDGCGD